LDFLGGPAPATTLGDGDLSGAAQASLGLCDFGERRKVRSVLSGLSDISPLCTPRFVVVERDWSRWSTCSCKS
jgi:hypothetical protein